MRTQYWRNIGWHTASTLTAKLLEPLVLIGLARLLVPEDFGIYAILVAIRALYAVVRDLGLAAAIIVDREQPDHRSLQFAVQLSTAAVGSLLVWATMPAVATWFEPEVAALMPWLCLSFLLSALEDTQVTYLRKNNAYRALFWRHLIPTLGFGVVSISMAYNGHGVISLVVGHIVGQALNSVYLLWCAGGVPAPAFDKVSLLRLMRLGRHVTAQSFMGYLVAQADSLIVGRLLPFASLGIYRMALQVAFLLPNMVVFQIRDVLFTEAAARADDSAYMQHRYAQFVVHLLPISIAYALALYALSPYLVPWLLGSHWSDLVQPLQLLSLTVVSGHLVNLNVDVGRLLGIAHIYTSFAILRGLLTLLTIYLTAGISFQVLLIGWVGITLLSNYANCLLFIKAQARIRVSVLVHVVFFMLFILGFVMASQVIEG